jgi:uncharacterized membrane protein YhaH (DUF805 family)
MQWMLMPLRRYADFQGRSRRKEFWMWQLLNIIIGGILYAILVAMMLGAASRAAVSTDDSGRTRYEDSRGGDSDRGSSRDEDSGGRGAEEESGSGEDGGKPAGDETTALDREPTEYVAYSYSGSYSSSSAASNEAMMRELGAGFWIVIGLATLYGLAVLIPNLAVTIRRLHDLDKSGWFIFLGLIPLVGPIILLVFYCTEGTRGPNRFGPDPKGGYPGSYR